MQARGRSVTVIISFHDPALNTLSTPSRVPNVYYTSASKSLEPPNTKEHYTDLQDLTEKVLQGIAKIEFSLEM